MKNRRFLFAEEPVTGNSPPINNHALIFCEGRLHDAINSNKWDDLIQALEDGCDPDEPDSYGWTPMHLAAFYGRMRMMGALVIYNGNINARTYAGWTPIHCAVDNQAYPAIEFLLGVEADLTLTNDANLTARALAARRRFGAIVQMIDNQIQVQQEIVDGILDEIAAGGFQLGNLINYHHGDFTGVGGSFLNR